jgi:hypothetical protein
MWVTRKSMLISLAVLVLMKQAFLPPCLSEQNSSKAKDAVNGVIKESQVWIHSRTVAYAMGDRMIKAGNERVFYNGKITRNATARTSPFFVAIEIPGKIRIENTESGSNHVIGSNGSTIWNDKKASLSEDDETFLEVFANDTVEHFLLLQTSGAAMRFYGANFRFDNGTAKNYSGPFYDVYEIADSVLEGGRIILRSKVYCINSKTKLLERVQYSVSRLGKAVRVETVLSDWQDYSGQRFPTSVTRMENGREIWKAEIKPTAVGRADSDNTFTHP